MFIKLGELGEDGAEDTEGSFTFGGTKALYLLVVKYDNVKRYISVFAHRFWRYLFRVILPSLRLSSEKIVVSRRSVVLPSWINASGYFLIRSLRVA